MKSKYLGLKINTLEVIDCTYVVSKTGKSGNVKYIMKCSECGNIVQRPATSVIKGFAKCSCQNKGRLGNIYASMRDRCENERNKSFKNYGAKGIKVCDEWQEFSNFKSWAIDNGYEDNLTIDRIDNKKGYEPSNCRWVTKAFNSGYTSRWGKDQNPNYNPINPVIERGENIMGRRNLKIAMITAGYDTVKDFCNETGISHSMMSHIINGAKNGSYETWMKIQEVLQLDNSQMWDIYLKQIEK